MRPLLLLALIFPFIASAVEAATPVPPDVAELVERRDLCDHFRGEEPDDAERKAFLGKAIGDLCTGTDQRLASLKVKYSSNPVVTAKLNQYEEDIELRQRCGLT